ncbi:MAG: VanW family protein [bacterium]|nr:VanW family protein [bacterium]
MIPLLSGLSASKYKLTLPIIIVAFLILEVSLLGIQWIYINQKTRSSEINHSARASTLFSALSKAGSQQLELLWNDGQQKKSIPLDQLTTTTYRQFTQSEIRRLDLTKLSAILTSLAKEIDHEPVNARLEFSADEQRIKEFSLSESGASLNFEKTVARLTASLANEQFSIPLVIDEIKPTITAEAIENMGITTLLGKGESNFDGSSTSRITNIRVGAKKFHGLLVKPGAEFSFNNMLGEIVASTGYQPELVIKDNKLVLEYGGGLCQVSTTLFRAAIYAGLPILERRPHSFAVRYYSPQGFDATIYPGSVDLRFKNDTPGYLLIQNELVGKKITFEIYGSSDNRRVVLDGPFQYDQQANGAMKAYFDRKIYYGDELSKKDRFSSNYRPTPASPLQKDPLQ